VDREQRRHDRERGPDEDGASVTAAGALDRERQRCERGSERGQADALEVDVAAEHHVPVSVRALEDERDQRPEFRRAGPAPLAGSSFAAFITRKGCSRGLASL
jgi:hypothetical protein